MVKVWMEYNRAQEQAVARRPMPKTPYSTRRSRFDTWSFLRVGMGSTMIQTSRRMPNEEVTGCVLVLRRVLLNSVFMG